MVRSKKTQKKTIQSFAHFLAMPASYYTIITSLPVTAKKYASPAPGSSPIFSVDTSRSNQVSKQLGFHMEIYVLVYEVSNLGDNWK